MSTGVRRQLHAFLYADSCMLRVCIASYLRRQGLGSRYGLEVQKEKESNFQELSRSDRELMVNVMIINNKKIITYTEVVPVTE